MQVFIHFKKQQVENFLSELSRLNLLHHDKSFQFSKSFYHFLDNLTNYFKQIGDSSSQAEVERIRNYHQMAEEGVDPESMEHVKTGRRTLSRKSAFRCLSDITRLLQQELEKDLVKLDQAEQTLGQLLILLSQSGAVNLQELPDDLSQDQIKGLWNELIQNDQVKLQERKLRLNITQEDIYLIFGGLLENLKN